MQRICGVVVALVALMAVGARAQQSAPIRPQPEDPLARIMFPPELVMQQQRAIALRAEQRAAITKAIQDFQARVVDLQWRMQDQTQRLAELLDRAVVEQAAVLAQVDEVLTVEREVKRAHMTLLIQIKNTLTAEQQTRLRALRDAIPE